MLEKVSAINYERCYPSRLKGFFQSSLNYKTYQDFVPYAKSSIVGNLPHEIVELFSPAERKVKLKEFQQVLAETAQACRDERYADVHEIFQKGIESLIPNSKAYIDFTGDGGYKDVWRITITDAQYKKIMHDKALLVYRKGNDVYSNVTHGLYAEPNSWIFLQSNMGCAVDNTQFTKHYISDLKNGYSLTEFIDKDIPVTKHNFEHNRLLGLYLSDCRMNHRKNNKVYDIGGLLRDKTFIKDRTTLKFFRKIANRNTEKERQEVASQLSKRAENPRTPLRRNIVEALDFYNSLPQWYWNMHRENVPNRKLFI